MDDLMSDGVRTIGLGEQSNGFIDITDEFFSTAKNIMVGDVVKSKFFALFEGTRALEVMNKVLDTGLIPLSQEDLLFDVKRPQDLQTVTSLSANLFSALMTWLNTSSLPVTVLSCRYVEECLKNFNGSDLNTCNFGIQPQDYIEDEEFLLVHKVFLSITRGFLIFIKDVILLGQAGVLYEEEDITTTTMGFDFLTTISHEQVRNDIEDSKQWLSRTIDDPKKEYLISFLELSSSFCLISKLLEYNVNLYHEIIPKQLVFLDVALNELKKIAANVDYFDNLPTLENGCFSEGIQKRNDNFLPPRPKHLEPFATSVDSAIIMVKDLQNMMNITTSKNLTEILDFLEAFMNKRDPPSHVIARAMLQLFLVRDDRSIMGSSKKKFIGFLVDDMSSITCYDSKVFQKFQEGGVPELNQELLEVLNNIESAYYSYILCVSQNPCRQRQHFNRSILVWDLLQVQAESFEFALKEKYNINDFFKNNNDDSEEIPVMPISSWVYYQKLRSMLEVLLRGIELEIYKIWELHSIFWYIEYLSTILFNHFQRIIATIEYKKTSIANMSKKIKKQKAGEKKQQLKELYKQKVENDLPQLDLNIELIGGKMLELNIINKLADQLKQLFTVLHDLQLLKLPKLNKIPEAMSYGLKMKSFQSVGVPEFPDYPKWCKLREHLISQVKPDYKKIELLEQIKANCNIIKTEVGNTYESTKSNALFTKEYQKSIHDQLNKSCVGLSLTVTLLLKQIKDNKTFVQDCANDKYEIAIERDGYHKSFPFFKISKK